MGFKRRGLSLMTHEGVMEGELTDHIACMASEVGKRPKDGSTKHRVQRVAELLDGDGIFARRLCQSLDVRQQVISYSCPRLMSKIQLILQVCVLEAAHRR